MKKKFDFFTILVVILCIIVILAFASMLANAVRATAADIEARETMERAQKRINLYKSSIPAAERPIVVVAEREEHETPDPEPAEDWYIESIPLDKQLQKVVFDAACENGVDYFLAMGLIHVESNFDVDAVSDCGCYGLTQLNPEYFPSGLSPEENVQTGMEYLGQLLDAYQGDVQAALRAFNRGYDDGARGYPNAVLMAAEDIMRRAGVVFP